MDRFSTPFPVQAVVDTRQSEPTSGPVDEEEGGIAGGSQCVVA
jgi:hypothetical protein